MTATVTIPAPRTPSPAERWEIVTRAQQGDPTAFAALYELYQPVVFRVIYRRTSGNRHLAEDLTQDVFTRAIKGIGSVTNQGRDFGAWLVTIAKNIVWDHYKSGRQRLELTTDEPGTVRGVDPADTDRRTDPVQVVVHNTTSVVLDAALAQLTAEQRQVLALRFGAGLSVTETAAAMGKNEGAVKAVQYRACQSMARLLRLAGEATSC